MSLSESAKRKLMKIDGATNLPGYYQFDNVGKAIEIINLFEHYIKENGRFQKIWYDACCDPNYQHLSAAIDYYKFNIKRPLSPTIRYK